MNKYTVGTKLFADFHFGGKPDCVCIEVIEEGTGKQTTTGQIRAKVTKEQGAYKKGEILILPAWQAVPKKEILPLERGQFFTRVSTNYHWVKPQ